MHSPFRKSYSPKLPDLYPTRTNPHTDKVEPHAPVHAIAPMVDLIADHQSQLPVRVAVKTATTVAKSIGRVRYNLTPDVLRRRVVATLGVAALAGAIGVGANVISATRHDEAGKRADAVAERLVRLHENYGYSGASNGFEKAEQDFALASQAYTVAADWAGMLAIDTAIGSAFVLETSMSRRREAAGPPKKPNDLELVASGVAFLLGPDRMPTADLGPMQALPVVLQPPSHPEQ